MVFCSACLLVCRKVISTFVHYLTWRNITKCSQRYRAKNCPDCFFGTAPRHHLFCGRDKSIYVHFTIKKWITPLNKKTYENYNPYIYIYICIHTMYINRPYTNKKNMFSRLPELLTSPLQFRKAWHEGDVLASAAPAVFNTGRPTGQVDTIVLHSNSNMTCSFVQTSLTLIQKMNYDCKHGWPRVD